MARIAYSLSGEGRGHATRVRTVVESLRRKHQVTILTSGPAFDLLFPVFDGTDVAIGSIEVPYAAYRDDGRLSLTGTAWKGLGYLSRLPRVVDGLTEFLEQCRFELVITDFEPALPRAAERLGLPVVSIDHQHVLRALEGTSLPYRLQRAIKWRRRLVSQFVPRAERRIVSSFYRAMPGPTEPELDMVGPLLGPEVLGATPSEGDHLVVYLRRHRDQRLLCALRRLGLPARIYGLGARAPVGNLSFAPTGIGGFVRDLASARALVASPGSQVIGEAVHLGKPVLAVAEPGNREQEINAWFLQVTGIGRSSPPEAVDERLIQEFLDDAPRYRRAIRRRPAPGNQDVDRILGEVLEGVEAARFDLSTAP